MNELKTKDIDSYYDSNEYEFAKHYLSTIKKSIVGNLHRYGVKMAERLVPDIEENTDTLREFIRFWNEFCKVNNAETVLHYFEGIDFYIVRKHNVLTWKAEFISKYPSEIENYVINSNHIQYIPHIEDVIL